MTSNTLHFAGLRVNYQLKNMGQYKTALFKHCDRIAYQLLDTKQTIRGVTIELAVETIQRVAQLKLPAILEDQVAMFEALDFKVETATDSRGKEFIVIFNK